MWKPYVRFSSFASGMKSLGKSSSHVAYLVREKECLLWEMDSRGDVIDDRRKAKERWKAIARMETGLAPLDTPAGRSRSDACIQVRLFLPLPNMIFDGMTDKEIRESTKKLVSGMGLDSTDILWALHRGEGGSKKKANGEQNLHLHIVYRPRNAAGTKHRISIRREVVSLRQSLGEWIQNQGLAVDWNSITNPGPRRHITPAKIAIAERGEKLHSREDELQAELIAAGRTLSLLSREDIAQRIVDALGSSSFGYGMLESTLRDGGWRIELRKRGKRTTWLVIDENGGKEFALRRILERTEEKTNAILAKLMKRDEALRRASSQATGTIEASETSETSETTRITETTGITETAEITEAGGTNQERMSSFSASEDAEIDVETEEEIRFLPQDIPI